MCDDKCPQYKSIGICSHSVAAAQANEELEGYIKWYCYKGTKHAPNLMHLAKHDMPLGISHKGNRVTKKMQSKATFNR